MPEERSDEESRFQRKREILRLAQDDHGEGFRMINSVMPGSDPASIRRE